MSGSLDGDPTPGAAERDASRAGPRLRVAVVNHVAVLGGAELALATVLPTVAEQVDLLVVLAEEGPLADTLRADGVDVRIVPLDRRVTGLRRDALAGGLVRTVLSLARYVLVLRRLLRAERVDVVHTNSMKAAFYGGVAGRVARVPVVMHLRDRLAPDYLPRPVVALARLAGRVLPRAVVANSATTLATLPVSPRVGRHVVLDAVRPSVRAAGPDDEAVVDGPPVVGLVGRLSPWKGQDLFLRAFARAFPDGDVRAALVGAALFGEDDHEADLHRLADELGIADRVEFRGFRSDVGAELARLTALVHCSVVPEPFGQVVIEGMAAGRAVIAADEGGPAEIVTDGVDGLLVRPRDPVALATAMSVVVGDPALRERLGRAGRARAAAFTPQAEAAELVAVYRDASAPRAAGVGR
ncbi:glycosyltransferase [Jatrophihabitans sp. YIM 134969]